MAAHFQPISLDLLPNKVSHPLQELNKCKTELQYWRSKSTQLLSLPTACAQCEAPLLPLNGAAGPHVDGFVFAELATLNDLNDLKTLANQVST